jgi:hypothetical protein
MGTITLHCVFLLSAAGTIPVMDVPRDRVDLIEINHFHDEQGRLVFEQVLFYEWSAHQERHQVLAWRLLKTSAQRPRHDLATGDYIALWNDGETLREVRAGAFRETWTQYDPELVDREFLPKERRRELARLHAPALKRKKPAPPTTVPAPAEVARAGE